MIHISEKNFYLQTNHTSYWFRVTAFNHLEHLYYGPLCVLQPTNHLGIKRTAAVGSSIIYDAHDPLYCLDQMCLEFSSMGKGDYRNSPFIAQMPDQSYVSDFKYLDYRLTRGSLPIPGLPSAQGRETSCETLEIILKDAYFDIYLTLVYTVYPDADVITRSTHLENRTAQPLVLKQLMSMCCDLPYRNYQARTFTGGWIKETHMQTHSLSPGTFSHGSHTGSSSNQDNPGMLISEISATEQQGWVFGFNLVYSGNHYSMIQRSSNDLMRVMMGIQPQGFEWILHEGELFSTPQAILSFSSRGYNGLSQNMHHFINHHIIPKMFQNTVRPIIYNHWEATFFKFNEKKLISLAKQAQTLGIELFVLDDGWFAQRNDDSRGLGDYTVNHRKFPDGLKSFTDKLHQMDMKVGLWVEPEMINADSNLYRNHPEYVVQTPHRAPSMGRNQLCLDLCNPEVCDYIVASVGQLCDAYQLDYIKWDYNRHLSDMFSPVPAHQGEFYHRYIMGLYSILERLLASRPHILLETCSSGGNRFDCGMLCYSPQIWGSDDTDPIERLAIQNGLSYLYPLSAIGAHVSGSPHQQTLRATPLSTRFNVAAFGVLGYEMDLNLLSREERKEIKEQISFYKIHRNLFQFGQFYRVEPLRNYLMSWQVSDDLESIVGWFQWHADASMGFDMLRALDLKAEQMYTVDSKPQRLAIDRFGELIKHVSPVTLHPKGLILNTVSKFYSLADCIEHLEASGAMLSSGVYLNNQFMGTYYNQQTRLLGDYGSTLYIIRKKG